MSDFNRDEYDAIFAECRVLSIKKNADYGNESLKQFGSFGVIVRMSDKMARLANLLKNRENQQVVDEKIEDSLKDLINYANYALMLERNKLEKWENE